MKFTAIAAALLATTASSANLPKRQATSYNVTNFYANCIPHSVMCSYSFTVLAESSMFPTNCTLMLQGADLLPAVPLTGCANNAYSWAVATTGSGALELNITTNLNSRTNLTGIHEITSDELEMQQNGASISQFYTGPQQFTVPIIGVGI